MAKKKNMGTYVSVHLLYFFQGVYISTDIRFKAIFKASSCCFVQHDDTFGFSVSCANAGADRPAKLLAVDAFCLFCLPIN